MPCLRRHAAPSPTALWITDDVLAAAWRRFTHVYNNTTTQKHTPRRRDDGGRRHGSNVPGPFEAYRRLARRRMGLASHSQTPNSGIDFGALFAFGTRGAARQDAEKGLRWEAPKKQQIEAGDHVREGSAWAYGWPGGTPKRKEAWESFMELPAEDEEPILDSELERKDPVLLSSDAFRELLANMEHVESVASEHLDNAIVFLQSTADEPDANNTARLVEWLANRSQEPSASAWRAIMDVIGSKIRLGTISLDECADVLKLLVHNMDSASPDYSRINRMMHDLEETSRASLLFVTERTTRLLAEESTSDTELPSAINAWLDCLVAQQYPQDPKGLQHKKLHPGQHKKLHSGIYRELSQKFRSPAVLREHLSTLVREDLADVLLLHWVPHIANVTTDSGDLGPEASIAEEGETFDVGNESNTNSMQVSITTEDPMPLTARKTANLSTQGFDAAKLVYRKPSACDPRPHGFLHHARSRSSPIHIQHLVTAWENYRAEGDRDRRNPALLIDLLAVLASHFVPWQELAGDIFTILSYNNFSGTNASVYGLFARLRQLPSLGVTSQLATRLIDHFVKTNDLRRAFRVFRGVPSVPLMKCHSLALAIATDSRWIETAAVWEILNRITAEDYKPRETLGQQRLVILPENLRFVQRLAFIFAGNEHLSPRIAFRRVWECYRFLRDRNAPLGKDISRAFVTAGVIRPLKAARKGPNFPKKQLEFVLSVVEAVEGRNVAEEVDRVVWEVWKRDVLPQRLKEFDDNIDEGPQRTKSERWKAVNWARDRHGVYEGWCGPKGTGGPKWTEQRYRPFAFGKADGGGEHAFTQSSPRAGADCGVISSTLEAEERPVGDALFSSGKGDSHAMATAVAGAQPISGFTSTGQFESRTELGEDHLEPLARTETHIVRGGPGYSAPVDASGQQATTTSEEARSSNGAAAGPSISTQEPDTLLDDSFVCGPYWRSASRVDDLSVGECSQETATPDDPEVLDDGFMDADSGMGGSWQRPELAGRGGLGYAAPTLLDGNDVDSGQAAYEALLVQEGRGINEKEHAFIEKANELRETLPRRATGFKPLRVIPQADKKSVFRGFMRWKPLQIVDNGGNNDAGRQPGGSEPESSVANSALTGPGSAAYPETPSRLLRNVQFPLLYQDKPILFTAAKNAVRRLKKRNAPLRWHEKNLLEEFETAVDPDALEAFVNNTLLDTKQWREPVEGQFWWGDVVVDRQFAKLVVRRIMERASRDQRDLRKKEVSFIEEVNKMLKEEFFKLDHGGFAGGRSEDDTRV